MSVNKVAAATTTTSTVNKVVLSSAFSKKERYKDLVPLREALDWNVLSSPGKVYRGDIIKMVQKLVGVAVHESLNRRDGFRPALGGRLIELEFRRWAQDFISRKGYFADEKLNHFYDEHVSQYIGFERGTTLALGGILASKYPARGEESHLKDGIKIWNDAYDTKRILNNFITEFKLLLGPDEQPKEGKTWDDHLEELRVLMYNQAAGSKGSDKTIAEGSRLSPDYIPNLIWLGFILFGPYGQNKYGTSLPSVPVYSWPLEDDEPISSKRPRIIDDSPTASPTLEALPFAQVKGHRPAALSASDSNTLDRYLNDSKSYRTMIRASLKILDVPNLTADSYEQVLKNIIRYQGSLEDHLANGPRLSSRRY